MLVKVKDVAQYKTVSRVSKKIPKNLFWSAVIHQRERTNVSVSFWPVPWTPKSCCMLTCSHRECALGLSPGQGLGPGPDSGSDHGLGPGCLLGPGLPWTWTVFVHLSFAGTIGPYCYLKLKLVGCQWEGVWGEMQRLVWTIHIGAPDRTNNNSWFEHIRAVHILQKKRLRSGGCFYFPWNTSFEIAFHDSFLTATVHFFYTRLQSAFYWALWKQSSKHAWPGKRSIWSFLPGSLIICHKLHDTFHRCHL